MIATLEYDGVPSLVSPPSRTPGIHLSDVIHRLLIFRGEVQDRTDAPDMYDETLWDIGRNHEFAVARRLEIDHPDRFGQLGELEVDGIKMNLDLLDRDLWRPYEIKWTQLSASNEPGSLKFWKYETQLLGYCKAIDSRRAALDVTHAQGFWEREWAKRRPKRRVWAYEFGEREIEQRWKLILNTADEMREERSASPR